MTGSVLFEAGLLTSRSLGFGVHAGWEAPRAVVDVGDRATVDGLTVGGGAWWAPDGAVAPLAAVLAEAAFFRFLDGDDTVDTMWTPRVSAAFGARGRLSAALSVVTTVLGSYDLRVTTVQEGASDPVEFSQFGIGASACLRAQFR